MANQIINVIVNSKGAVTVARELNAMGDAARTTTTYLNGLRSILASAMAFSGINAIVETADMFTVLQNRLRQVSDETTTVGESWNRLMKIADGSYSSIQGTVDLYFRVSQAFRAWGESAEKAYEFTELFQKSAILSGSSMQTTSQAVYQFSQALNKGKLDGDEFRSVLEGLPYVASLIQKSLGVTRAELYEMSKDGKISVDRIRQAFTDAAAVIRGDWANITPTIGMAMVVLKNKWVDFVGEVQTSTGVFSLVAQLILAVANNFWLLAAAMTPVAIAMVYMAGKLGIGLVVIAFRDLMTGLKLLIPILWQFNLAAAANPYVLIALAIAAVVAALVYFRNEIGLTNENLSKMWSTAAAVFTTIIEYVVSATSYVVNLIAEFVRWTGIIPAISKAIQLLQSAFMTVFNGIIAIVRKAGSYIASAFGPVWSEIVALVKEFGGLVSEVTQFLIDTFMPVVEKLGRVWAKVFKDHIQPPLSWVMKILSDIYDGWVLIGGWLKDVFKGVIKDVFDGWILILRVVLNFIRDIIAALRTAVALMQSLSGAGGGGKKTGGAHYGAQFQAGEGFATGGAFKVGGTGAGRDTTPVAFRAERGERVTVETKKQQRAADNSNGGGTQVKVPVSIVNVIDPSMVIEANQTAAGTRSIINVIASNREEFQRILGVA